MGHLTEFVVVPMYYTFTIGRGYCSLIYTGIGIVNVCTTIAKCCARIAHILPGHSLVSMINFSARNQRIYRTGPLYF